MSDSKQVIPEGWKKDTLGNIVHIVGGGTPPTTNPEYWGGDILWCSTTDITGNKGKYIKNTERKITSKGLSLSATKLMPANTLLVCTRATIGDAKISSKPISTSQGLKSLTPKDGNNIEFLYYKISTLKKALTEKSSGSTFLEISKKELSAIEVTIPTDPKEQERIARILSDTDAMIETLDKLIAKKRSIKLATMQELLTGKTRLPGFETNKGFKLSAIGEIPKDWELKKLQEVCKIKTGKKDVNEGNPNGRYPFFTCSVKNTFSDSYSFDMESILIAGNGDVGNLHYYKGKFEAYQRTYVLYDFTCNVEYLWQQLENRLIKSLGVGKIGSSIPYIKKENLSDFLFPTSLDIKEQIAICKLVGNISMEIENLEKKLSKLIMIKKSIMSLLLKGKTASKIN